MKCAMEPNFKLKNYNIQFVINSQRGMRTPEGLPTDLPMQSQVASRQPLLAAETTTPRRKVTLTDVPISVRKQIISDAQKTEKKRSLKADTTSVYGGYESLKAHDRKRMRMFGEQRDHAPRKHTGEHSTYYSYDKELIIKELLEVADENKNLSNKMNGKWESLGRRAKVRS